METPAPNNLETLLRAFAKTEGLQAEFIEERRMTLLALPLETRGTIYYAAPDLFARHTTSPSASALIVDSHHVWIEEAGKRAPFRIESAPHLRPLIAGFLNILQGDARALRQHYEVEFALKGPTGRKWKVVLLPRTKLIKGVIDRLEVEGEGHLIGATRLVESNGDETVTKYHAVNPNRRFDADEKADLFGTIPPQ